MTLYDIICGIVADKEAGRRRPLIATFPEIYARQADSWAAMYEKLLELEACGIIHIGNTLNGKYVKIMK